MLGLLAIEEAPGTPEDLWAIKSGDLWRKRVGVEPTIRPAKDRIAGFEGREDHRTPFASIESIESGANSFNRRSRGFGANQRCNQVVELRTGADFVVRMRGRRADFAVGEEFARKALS